MQRYRKYHMISIGDLRRGFNQTITVLIDCDFLSQLHLDCIEHYLAKKMGEQCALESVPLIFPKCWPSSRINIVLLIKQ